MTDKVYLAFYKGRKTLLDRVIQRTTKGKYSHVEIVIADLADGKTITMLSSSPRDGGVRLKRQATLKKRNWDFFQVNNVTPAEVMAYYKKNEGKKYDLWGAIGTALFPLRQSNKKLFCSEFCYNAIFNSDEGWRFSPSQLYIIAKTNSRYRK